LPFAENSLPAWPKAAAVIDIAGASPESMKIERGRSRHPSGGFSAKWRGFPGLRLGYFPEVPPGPNSPMARFSGQILPVRDAQGQGQDDKLLLSSAHARAVSQLSALSGIFKVAFSSGKSHSAIWGRV
jgi:hypothetical protein